MVDYNSMSIHSAIGSDSDYDIQTKSPLGSEIPSTMNETHGSNATSVSPSATATLSKSWQNMQKGHLIQANLFCYMLPKSLTLQLNQNQENKEVGHAIGNAMFVVILELGVIVRSRCIFWV